MGFRERALLAVRDDVRLVMEATHRVRAVYEAIEADGHYLPAADALLAFGLDDLDKRFRDPVVAEAYRSDQIDA